MGSARFRSPKYVETMAYHLLGFPSEKICTRSARFLLLFYRKARRARLPADRKMRFRDGVIEFLNTFYDLQTSDAYYIDSP